MIFLRQISIALVFACITITSQASEWVSPIDTKYKNKNPKTFAMYVEARNLIDSSRGQQQVLMEADKILKEVLLLDSSFAPAYREYGRLYIKAGYINSVGDVSSFKKGSLGPSEQSILRSIDIEADYADAYVLLGHLYTKMKLFSEAEKALKKAEDIGTELPWLDLNWADLLKLKGKSEEALLRFKKVIKGKTSNKGAYSKALRGVTRYYESKGDNEKAKIAYLDHLDFEPDSAWDWGNYSSFLLFDYGDVNGAIENGEKALSIMNYGMGRFNLACALYTKWAMLLEKGDSRAQTYFDQAMSIYPDLGEVMTESFKHKATLITANKLFEYQNNKLK